MRYVVAIDPPMLLDSSICVGCIDDIFSSEYSKSVILIGYDDFWVKLIESDIKYELLGLAEKALETIVLYPKSNYLKSNPHLIPWDATTDNQTKGLLYFLHIKRTEKSTVFISSVSRVPSSDKEIETIVDHRSQIHHLLVREDSSFDSFMQSLRPVLNQLKHTHVARMGAMGHVSPFSAYDKYDKTYAEWLLQQAYNDYNGSEDEPKYLYTFDKRNKTFVQFRSDRRREYHGMDFDKEKLPDEFKYLIEKYHQ